MSDFFGGQFFGGGFFGSVDQPRGTAAFLGGDRGPTSEQTRRSKQRFEIPVEAAEVIAEVAQRQVLRQEHDEQKRYEELTRELELRRIEYEARYLEALADERQRLLDAQKAARLAEIMALLMAAGRAWIEYQQSIEGANETLIVEAVAKVEVMAQKLLAAFKAQPPEKVKEESDEDNVAKRIKAIQEQFIGALHNIVKSLPVVTD